MAAIQMLNELQRLKSLHSSYKQNMSSTVIQPNTEQQKLMIAHNFSHKIVSMAIKRETIKYVFDQKMKLQEEMRRKQSDEEGSVQYFESKETKPLRRMQTAPNARRHTDRDNDSKKVVPLSNIGRMKSSLNRPHTTQGFRTHSGKVEDFVQTIKSAKDVEDFEQDLQDQVVHSTKDSKKVFEVICKHFKGGLVCQFTPHKNYQEIDLTPFISSNPMEKVTKLEDLAAYRKKDGMLIYFDPSTHTFSHKVTLRISYLKPVDIGEEQVITKDVSFWSNGSYYGLKLVKDLLRAQTGLSGFLSLDADEPIGGDSTKPNLPGWNAKTPVFIPAPACKIEIITLGDHIQGASLSYHLSHLRLFALSCPNLKQGMKKLSDFLSSQLYIELSNSAVAGGLSPLHLASLHGNFNALQLLVQLGGGLNTRCRGDKFLTPLHEAVIGGHASIVKFLLAQGASQIIADEQGRCPLHYACQLGHVTLCRLLMEGEGGRRALLLEDKGGKKPYDLCATHYLKSRVEAVMRKHKIFKKPRVSIMERMT